jgi:hypothetical protein
MSLILLRADNQSKILNALADIERHANLNIVSKPKILDNNFADDIAKNILKTKLKTKSKSSVVVQVKEDTTKSILQVKKIHPPAHIIIISEEYPEYDILKSELVNAKLLRGYYSHKQKTSKNNK